MILRTNIVVLYHEPTEMSLHTYIYLCAGVEAVPHAVLISAQNGQWLASHDDLV
jgi:hypothetical protein